MMLPTTLYIHIPWCIQKCPYCDFNSHRLSGTLQEGQYIDKLLADLRQDLSRYGSREIHAIFIGGGTPSLLSGKSIQLLIDEIAQILPLRKNLEVTLEANPGTVEQDRFKSYREAGVNRLSLGIQSFNQYHLKILGRIHNHKDAHRAIEVAQKANFGNINLDIMHGLPNQSIKQGLNDLKLAIDHNPNHISWYQLTIEPNTVFYKIPPKLPNEDDCAALEEEGFSLLSQNGYNRYEISAFSKPGKASNHNLNYWTYGDYYGIGAGAHGKITSQDQQTVFRTHKKRQPKDYLNSNVNELAQHHQVRPVDLVFEFMLNATRLQQPISMNLFTQRTGLNSSLLTNALKIAATKGFINLTSDKWQITKLGRRFTNDLQALFLAD